MHDQGENKKARSIRKGGQAKLLQEGLPEDFGNISEKPLRLNPGRGKNHYVHGSEQAHQQGGIVQNPCFAGSRVLGKGKASRRTVPAGTGCSGLKGIEKSSAMRKTGFFGATTGGGGGGGGGTGSNVKNSVNRSCFCGWEQRGKHD